MSVINPRHYTNRKTLFNFYSPDNHAYLFVQLCRRLDIDPMPPASVDDDVQYRLWNMLPDLINEWKLNKMPANEQELLEINQRFIQDRFNFIRENINYFHAPVSRDGDDALHMNMLLRHDRYDSPFGKLNHKPNSSMWWDSSFFRPIYKYCNKPQRNRYFFRMYERDIGETLARTRELDGMDRGYDMSSLKIRNARTKDPLIRDTLAGPEKFYYNSGTAGGTAGGTSDNAPGTRPQDKWITGTQLPSYKYPAIYA